MIRFPFDTLYSHAREWMNVYLLWRDFVLVVRVKVDAAAAPLNLCGVEHPEALHLTTVLVLTGEWVNVYLPWRDFVPVVRVKVDAAAAPLDPSKIEHLGLILSRFAFNETPNPNHHAGAFELRASPRAPCCVSSSLSGLL